MVIRSRVRSAKKHNYGSFHLVEQALFATIQKLLQVGDSTVGSGDQDHQKQPASIAFFIVHLNEYSNVVFRGWYIGRCSKDEVYLQPQLRPHL